MEVNQSTALPAFVHECGRGEASQPGDRSGDGSFVSLLAAPPTVGASDGLIAL